MGRCVSLIISALIGMGSFPALVAAQQAGQETGTRASVPSTNSVAINGSPVDVSEHFRRFTKAVFSWQTAVVPAATAGFSQLATTHKGYHDDWSGFGKHYGLNVADDISFNFIGKFALPAAFHQDEQYTLLGSAAHFQGRLGHILNHVFVAKSADGRRNVFNVSGIPACLLTAVGANAYVPQAQRNASWTAQRFGFNLAAFVAEDTFTEFKGDLKRLLTGHK